MELCIYKDKVVAHQRMGRIEGMLQTMLPEIAETPKIQWHGTKIPERLWERVKSFMTWTQNEYHSEAQIRLYYNDLTNRWRALAWPQYIGTGMFSEEIKGDHDNKARLMPLIDVEKGWYEFGTVHHHCTSSAFQSGTDHKDEIDRPGIHITLGNVLSDSMSIHARFVTKKIQYDVDLTEWITGNLTSKSEASFPKMWADQCFKKPPVVVQPWQSRFSGAYGSYQGTQSYPAGDFVFVPGFGYRKREELTAAQKEAVAEDLRLRTEPRSWAWDDEDDLGIPPKIKLPTTKVSKDDISEHFTGALEALDTSLTDALQTLASQYANDVAAELDQMEWTLGTLSTTDRIEFARLARERFAEWLETEAQIALEDFDTGVEAMDDSADYPVGP